MAAQVSRPRPAAWQVFYVSAALVTVASIVFVTWTALHIGGDQVTIAVDDIGEAVAALLAAVSCGAAAYRATGRLRFAWGLLAGSAASWCIGGIIRSVYQVGLGVALPYPSAADFGFLAAIPLAVAGILSFSHASRGTSEGIRLWVDRAIVLLALVFVGWEMGLDRVVFDNEQESLFNQAIDVAYPFGDIVIGTVLVMAIRWATDEQQGRLLLLLGGLASNAVADSAFAYLNATGAYGPIGSVLDAGWVIGYLLIGLAALWPSGKSDRVEEERPIDVWQLALPWLAILAAGVAAIIQAAEGNPLSGFATLIVGVLAVLLMVSQVLAHNESLALLLRSRLSAATLNEVIVYAPLGMLRIGHDLKILQANPSMASMLRTTVKDLIGAPVARFFSAAEIARASARFSAMRGREGVTTDFDTLATRTDGTALWIHWTASTVRKPDGAVDFHLVMLEDISARKAADEVAAANLEVLERLNRVKSQFLTKVSHEFRTALVGIQGFSEFIREADTLEVDEVKAFASDIYDDARRLDRTLSEMLELDRSEVGRSELQLVEVDLAAIIREAIASVQIGTADHSITTDLEELPKITADPGMVSQVVTSLLGRAVDYSPAGAPVLVTARAAGELVQVSVTDRGQASASDLEAQLLGRGYVPSNAQIRVLAANVGLPLARQIVEMHGGRIWFEVGAGTVWTFTLPVSRNPVLSPAGPA